MILYESSGLGFQCYSTFLGLSLTQQCFSGLVGLVLARVAGRIFITGTCDSFIVQFGRVVCFPFYSLNKLHVPYQPNVYGSLILLASVWQIVLIEISNLEI
jgi:hypothetical protein